MAKLLPVAVAQAALIVLHSTDSSPLNSISDAAGKKRLQGWLLENMVGPQGTGVSTMTELLASLRNSVDSVIVDKFLETIRMVKSYDSFHNILQTVQNFVHNNGEAMLGLFCRRQACLVWNNLDFLEKTEVYEAWMEEMETLDDSNSAMAVGEPPSKTSVYQVALNEGTLPTGLDVECPSYVFCTFLKHVHDKERVKALDALHWYMDISSEVLPHAAVLHALYHYRARDDSPMAKQALQEAVRVAEQQEETPSWMKDFQQDEAPDTYESQAQTIQSEAPDLADVTWHAATRPQPSYRKQREVVQPANLYQDDDWKVAIDCIAKQQPLPPSPSKTGCLYRNRNDSVLRLEWAMRREDWPSFRTLLRQYPSASKAIQAQAWTRQGHWSRAKKALRELEQTVEIQLQLYQMQLDESPVRAPMAVVDWLSSESVDQDWNEREKACRLLIRAQVHSRLGQDQDVRAICEAVRHLVDGLWLGRLYMLQKQWKRAEEIFLQHHDVSLLTQLYDNAKVNGLEWKRRGEDWDPVAVFL